MEKNDNIELVERFVNSYNSFKKEISKVIVGQDHVIDHATYLTCFFSNRTCVDKY